MLLNPMITFSLTSILWIGVCAAPSPFQPFISRFPRYDYGLSVAQLFERQAGGAFQAVTGAGYDPANDGPVPARKEIREFEKDANQWTLFLLALDAMQATSQDDPLSWYKIAGIHGLPYELYDSVQAVEGNEDRGYCPVCR